jgi:hypothetical protein
MCRICLCTTCGQRNYLRHNQPFSLLGHRVRNGACNTRFFLDNLTEPMKYIHTIKLINLHFKQFTGFEFRILSLEIGPFEGTLLGIDITKSGLWLHAFFFMFEVIPPIEKTSKL